MFALQIPSRHIEADGVAKHIIIGFFFGDILPFTTQDHRHLRLVVQAIRRRMLDDFTEMTDHRSGGFREEYRGLRRCKRHGPGPGTLGDMLLVVDPQHENVLSRPGDR